MVAIVNPILLTTKFYRPAVPTKWVQRPQLGGRLTKGLEAGRRMTLVSASAGFGKTSVVSAWLAQMTDDYAWLSLDQYDDDPNRFWQYVVAALQSADPAIGSSVQPLLASNPLPPPPALLTGLLNDLAESPTSHILVLDDYHHIADRTIHKGLDFLLEHAPAQLHIVLITPRIRH